MKAYALLLSNSTRQQHHRQVRGGRYGRRDGAATGANTISGQQYSSVPQANSTSYNTSMRDQVFALENLVCTRELGFTK